MKGIVAITYTRPYKAKAPKEKNRHYFYTEDVHEVHRLMKQQGHFPDAYSVTHFLYDMKTVRQFIPADRVQSIAQTLHSGAV